MELMNIISIRFWTFVIISASFLFHARAQSTNRAFLSSSVTFDQVSNVVKKGVSREAVIKAFGEPPVEREKISNFEWEDTYPMEMPKRLADFKDEFAGFEVRYLSNRVESWSAIESGPLVFGTNDTPLESLAGTNIAEIAFHVVYETPDPVAGYRYIDTPSLPHLGIIMTNADFVARDISHVALTEANLFPPSAGKEYDITIRFSDSQTNVFAKFTRQRIGKRLLMMIDNEPITAPLIMEPIADGEFMISFRDKKEAEEMMKRLSKTSHPAP